MVIKILYKVILVVVVKGIGKRLMDKSGICLSQRVAKEINGRQSLTLEVGIRPDILTPPRGCIIIDAMKRFSQ